MYLIIALILFSRLHIMPALIIQLAAVKRKKAEKLANVCLRLMSRGGCDYVSESAVSKLFHSPTASFPAASFDLTL